MTPCPDDNALNAFADGLLPDHAATTVEAHLAECATCAALVTDIRWSPDDEADAVAALAELPLAAGERIGRYVVRSIIGQGGMGTVYLADDPELDRQVALKVLRDARAPTAAVRDRLSREARTMAKLADPGIVTVYDAGEASGRFYIAMQLVEGQTLATWLGAAVQPIDDVIAVFTAAGRALSAAHAAGIVHRDFKPENVLLDAQGRALVTDFGIAFVPQYPMDPVSLGSGDASSPTRPRFTQTGALLGTPRYMAPEQHRSSDVTPASDQYSFCVSLHEALYGRPPFVAERGPGSLDTLLDLKMKGPPPPPAKTRVPVRVQRIILRGLAPAPEARFGAMSDLVLALENASPAARMRRRRTAFFGAAAVGVTVLLAGSLARSAGRSAPDPCAHVDAELGAAWSDDAKVALHRAFVASGRRYAEDTANKVEGRLDVYAKQWTTMRGELCRAPGDGKGSREIAAMRDLCLERRRDRFAALTRLFSDRPDGEVVDKAVQAVADLPPIASCNDAEALVARVRRPEEPGLRARVMELERRADDVAASGLAGRNAQGIALGVPLLADAEATRYAPLLAEVQFELGKLRAAAGEYPAARVLYRDAAASAAEGHDDVLEVNVWARMLFLVSENQQRLDEAGVVYELGGGPVRRAHEPLAEAAWLSSVGAFLGRKGSYDASESAYRRVVELREANLGVEHPLVAAAYHNMGALMNERGEWKDAKLWDERALAVKEKTLGPEHPSVALSLNNLGLALVFTGDEAGGLALYDRALRIWESTLGPQHPRLATVLGNIGEARAQEGDPRAALPFFERAIAIREKALGHDHPDLASPLAGLGRAHVHLGELAIAEPLLNRALTLTEKAVGPMHQDLSLPLLALGELELARRAPAKALPYLTRAWELPHFKRKAELGVALAEALWRTGDHATARERMESARAGFAKNGRDRAAETADAWLRAHVDPDTTRR